MKFAHFSHIWRKPGMPHAERYAQLWRELELPLPQPHPAEPVS